MYFSLHVQVKRISWHDSRLREDFLQMPVTSHLVNQVVDIKKSNTNPSLTKTWGQDSMSYCWYVRIYQQVQIKRTSLRRPRNGLLQKDASVQCCSYLSVAVLDHFCGVRYLWSSQLPVAQILFCLASTMGELRPAICAGNFKDVFWFTFCYNVVF